MSGAAARLRVAIAAAEPASAARLADLAAACGHDIVEADERVDVVLTDGSADPRADVPIVAVGAEGEFAGLLPSEAGAGQIDAALRAVAAGLVVRPLPVTTPGFAALPAPCSPLSPREIEVLRALAAGLTNKAAARRLGISPHTVKFHIESLFRKLGATSRAEAVAKGLTRQIVEL